ncbi:MAG: helix-turn-helix transcriptional regulator [Lachnospiraceae bacterium]|nr:helix-turn-helix transcriptional regulator [Lachnospiraceae bacterium]
MKSTYDRLAASERLRLKRILLGFTQEEVAEKIDRASKYYADIERGSCGMSVETLMAISTTLDLSLDYVIYGKIHSENEIASNTSEVAAIMNLLNNSSERKRKYALQMLKIFLIACDNMFDESSQEDKGI